MKRLFDRQALIVVLLALLVTAVCGFVMARKIETRPQQKTVGDIALFRLTAQRVTEGQIVHRDFDLEYPPLCAGIMAVPALGSHAESETYFTRMVALFALSGLFAMVVPYLLLRGAGISAGYLPFLVAGLALSLGLGLVDWLQRFDIIPAALTATGLVLFVRGVRMNRIAEEGWGLFLTAFAGTLKLWPFIPLLLMLAWSLSVPRSGRRTTMLGVAMSLAFLPTIGFIVVGPGGFMRFIEYHTQRGMEVGSVFATLAWLRDGGAAGSAAVKFGSYQYDSPSVGALLSVAKIANVAFPLLVLGAVGTAIVRAKDVAAKTDLLLLGSVVATVAFIVTNKVFSPQYCLWIATMLPGLAFLSSGRVRSIAAWAILVFSVACGLQMARGIFEPVNALGRTMVLLAIKNAVCLACAGTLSWTLLRCLRHPSPPSPDLPAISPSP